jgi:hypothetical protein
MLSPVRWGAELEMMRRAGLGFEPFIDDKHFGFTGKLPGRSGRPYDVEIRADRRKYPAKAPKVFIHPRVGGNYLLDGSLCVIRTWRPGQDTLAQQALYAAKYLFEHG